MEPLIAKIKLYVVEIPATLVLAPLGFIMEFLITLPFMLVCELDGMFKKRT
jgi:hypothetical protein